MLYFVFPLVIYLGIPALALIAWWRWYYYKRPLYHFPLITVIMRRGYRKHAMPWRAIVFGSRCAILALLIIALGRLQQVDETSRISVKGVDIMVVLDVSESMILYDDVQDARARKEVACSALLRFIEMRSNDPMGLVIFGAAAVSRCPLTLDKQLLATIIKEATQNCMLNPQGTVLCTGLAMAANRLRSSSARTKVIILVTDGLPTQGDIDPSYALSLLQHLGIKVYTISVGSSGGYMRTPFGFIPQQTPPNRELLCRIADQTGGQFFEAHKPADLERICGTIDTLEKDDHEMPFYAHYWEWFIVCLLAAALWFLGEIIIISFVWLSL
jgi:Ca-activated chloride channel homolog